MFFYTVSRSLGENTSIRPAEDLTEETGGSIHNEWSPTWGSTQSSSLLSYLKSSKSTIPASFTDYINLLKYILSKKKKMKKKTPCRNVLQVD